MPQHAQPSKLWWLYFALYLLVVGFGVVTVFYGLQMGFGFNVVALLATAIEALCLAGLVFHIKQQAVWLREFWIALLFVFSAKLLIGGALFLKSFFMFRWESSTEQWLYIISLCSLLLSLPMPYAIWRYAFRSPALWGKR